MSDRVWLLRTLALAENGRGQCAPNPAVGALLEKNGEIIHEGFHLGAGLSHAEVQAIRGFEEAARGATLYVSLEPCCHVGRTPACTELLKSVGVARVVYAFADPNPKVSGQGAQALRDAGIEVKHLELPEANLFYRSYAHWWKTGRPFVTAKLALSLDGKIAGENGVTARLTGDKAQMLTHWERLRADVLLTSLKTIRADDPRMNVRMGDETVAKPLFVVGQGEFPARARVLTTAKKVTWIQFPQANPAPVGVDVWTESLQESLHRMGREGAHDVWVEAGGQVFKSLWESGWVDRALLYLAPQFLGGRALAAFPEGIQGFPGAGKVTWQVAGADAICEVVK